MTTVVRRPVPAGTWGWADRQRFFVDADRRLRTPIPTSRRVSLISLVGGAGTSTVAAGVARVAAARRGTPVLAVDAAGARWGLAARLGRDGDRRVTEPTDLAPAPQTFAEASSPLQHDGALHYLGLGHPASDSWPSDAREWRSAIAPVGRFFPLVVTDWGRRRDLGAIAEIARSSHAMCVVAPADRAGLENAAALAAAIGREEQPPDTLVVLVDRAGVGAGPTRVHLRGTDAAVRRIRFDPSLAEGAAPRRRTRLALLDVAAALVAGPDREDVG